MAEMLNFELVSPERLLMSEEVEQVVIPGTEGEMTILVNHAPVLSNLKPGVVDIRKSGGDSERVFVRGGFAEVNPTGLTVLAEQAIPMAELDAAALAEQIANAQSDVDDAKTDEKRRVAAETLEHLKQLQSAL